MIFYRVLSACPLLGGLSSFGVSFIRGFTVIRVSKILQLPSKVLLTFQIAHLLFRFLKVAISWKIPVSKFPYYNDCVVFFTPEFEESDFKFSDYLQTFNVVCHVLYYLCSLL